MKSKRKLFASLWQRGHGLNRRSRLAGGALREEVINVDASNAYPSTDADCGKTALVDPVPDRLRVELEVAGHLIDSEEFVFPGNAHD